MGRWRALVILGTAQFLMVLDTSVMNVSISQLVKDFDTEVTAIQAVITLYTLVMAAFMITGGKLGDMLGRRRAFSIGLMVYGTGSALTAVAPVLWVLAVGLVGHRGARRRAGAAGAGRPGGRRLHAAGTGPWPTASSAGCPERASRSARCSAAGSPRTSPGGWSSPPRSSWWSAILCFVRWIGDHPRPEPRPRLDGVGTVLSALGLALVVLGVLQSSSWGWLQAAQLPVHGLRLLPRRCSSSRREPSSSACSGPGSGAGKQQGREPLVRFSLLGLAPLRSGLAMLLAQNLILLGLFFAIPLYLQVVQGFDAFQTGLRLLPVSVTMLVSAMSGPLLGRIAGPRAGRTARPAGAVRRRPVAAGHDRAPHRRRLVRLRHGRPRARHGPARLPARQRRPVRRRRVRAQRGRRPAVHRPEPRLLAGHRSDRLDPHRRAGARVHQPRSRTTRGSPRPRAGRPGSAIEAGVSFVSTDQVRAGRRTRPACRAPETDAIVDSYATAQLDSLKAAILATAGVTLAGLAFTRHLPTGRLTGTAAS